MSGTLWHSTYARRMNRAKKHFKLKISRGTNSFQLLFGVKSEVTALIETATSKSLLGADQELNTRICDAINKTPKEGANDAIRVLQKRIRTQSPLAQMLSLTLLDRLVRSCGMEMHTRVASQDFMGDMLSMVSTPNNIADKEVSEKAISLIQCWGESFKPYQDIVPIYYEQYRFLKRQGATPMPANVTDIGTSTST